MFIVGIGASAGGLQALKEFYRYKQATEGEAYVVILHSLRNYESRLVYILQRLTPINCVLIEDGMELSADTIFVSPPSHSIDIINGRFSLTERLEDEKVNHTVNHFFKSLALHAKSEAVGVIMSGTGTDGTDGSRDIENNGGVVIVQDPKTAQFDGMPLTSIRYDHPDYVASPKEMVGLIDNIVGGKELKANRKTRELVYD